jgi:hypothetical protein
VLEGVVVMKTLDPQPGTSRHRRVDRFDPR